MKDVDDKKGRRRIAHFLILGMAAATARFFEAPALTNKDYALRKVDFFGSHSNILKSAESRMCTALQFYLRTQNSRREAKPTTPKQLRE